jgi:hypothetical protein
MGATGIEPMTSTVSILPADCYGGLLDVLEYTPDRGFQRSPACWYQQVRLSHNE